MYSDPKYFSADKFNLSEWAKPSVQAGGFFISGVGFLLKFHAILSGRNKNNDRGSNSMRIHNHSFLLSFLVSACFTVSVQAQEAVSSGLWSDSSTWSGGAVPQEGKVVTIGAGMEVVLDVSPPALNGINLNGILIFADDEELELTTEWILNRGKLEIGTESDPYTGKATITLTDNVQNENINGMGDRGIMNVLGTLSLHGDRENSWTKLTETAEAGSTRIEVLDASGWRVGDEIVLASTDFNPRQAETRQISRIRGNRITLDEPLDYMHFGEITFDVDERGEVGVLTRNIKVQASADAEGTYFGGHIMAMDGSTMTVSGIELTRMGQHLELARYPIHWHINGDVTGQYIKNSAIHNTYNRCVTIHGTNNLRVENNVTYNTVGHCFFMEDGIETGNQVVNNLGIQTKCHPTLACDPTNLGVPGERGGPESQRSSNALLPSDNTAATFWITNPSNDYIGNVAAGSDSTGFWMSLPEHPVGAFEGTEISQITWPRRMPQGEFRGNVAHSNFDGLMFDRNIVPDNTFGVTGSSHIARENPANPNSPSIESVVEDFTGYKNRNGGIWSRGEMKVFKNLKLADNAIGYTHASGSAGRDSFTSKVIDSLFVGETDNIGNPMTDEEIAYGRSMPKKIADYPIRGYEFYDYQHLVENTTFVNYTDNDTRGAGALSYLMYTSFGMHTENAVKGLEFINAKPVHFPPVVQKWASDFGRRNAWRGATIHDLDGSVGGIPDAYIVLDNGIASDEEACELKPSWGAAVCRGDMGRFSVGVNVGFGNGPITDPVMLSRNGRRFEYTGVATIRSGAEVRVETARQSLSLSLREMDEDGWVIFELPGFTTTAGGTQQSSLDALRNATNTAYYKDDDTLWVKLVVDDTANEGPVLEQVGRLVAQANLDVSR
ncbi:MAG: transmembrane domain-containing protein [Gammaproteobacteria bacterium]|nr:transmembrane domain-containing protein [Gammaproteobacteria bacterium]